MERWLMSEVWRELKGILRELSSLAAALLPWIPAIGLAILGLDQFGWQAAPVIVLLTPWYRWLLRKGKPPVGRPSDLVPWLVPAGLLPAALQFLVPPLPAWVAGTCLVITTLVWHAIY